MRRLFVAGNWKMNHFLDSATGLGRDLAEAFPSGFETVDVLVCPPFPYLIPVRDAIAGSAVQFGAQNAWHEAPGAFTGEVALEMLVDIACPWVIVGHSERRHILGESDELLNKKVTAALSKGLKVIFCVGEKLDQREANQTEAVLDSQMESGLKGIDEDAAANLVIAYEPVWAIGTGVRATEDQAEAAHVHLRKWLEGRYNSDVAENTRILYGGSVKPADALGLLKRPNVDGALVGGASLDAKNFVPIVQAAVEATE